jgi:nucleoside 2-deoxyribosyltransferase
MPNTNKTLPLGYVGGDIMTHGSQLARQEECDKMDAAGLEVTYYSPAQNKSINDKSNMTEEQNNCLAEKITEADIDRLWNSDFAVMCTEQSAIGTMCELGCLFGWKYMADKLLDICGEVGTFNEVVFSEKKQAEVGARLVEEISRIYLKNIFAHYFDIRTNHLNEKDWRRSFSINQLLYGMILYCTKDGKLHENFDSVLEELKKLYGEDATNE